jgi:hypothetical protein
VSSGDSHAISVAVAELPYLSSRRAPLRHGDWPAGSLVFGGEGGIRTHEPLAQPPVFKTGAINRSATSPF